MQVNTKFPVQYEAGKIGTNSQYTFMSDHPNDRIRGRLGHSAKYPNQATHAHVKVQQSIKGLN